MSVCRRADTAPDEKYYHDISVILLQKAYVVKCITKHVRKVSRITQNKEYSISWMLKPGINCARQTRSFVYDLITVFVSSIEARQPFDAEQRTAPILLDTR
jgi:hypothetical protein